MSLNIPTQEPPTSVGQYCFDGSNQDQYQEYIGQAMNYLRTYMQQEHFFDGTPAAELQQLRGRIQADPNRTMPMEEALAEMKAIYLDHTVRYHHPRYVAHLNCPVVLPALVGDLIATAANTAIETWDQSTSATLIEEEIISWITQHLQLGFRADGVFTSGGTQSNLMALLMARDHYAYTHYGINLKEGGWAEQISRFRIFCSDKAHFSVKKNAALLGMGYQSVVSVPSDGQMRMRPESLEKALERERAKGNIPIAVVATLGTTDYGSFDPLERISEITRAQQLWLHVDGAYGGCFVLTKTHRPRFEGVQFADSVTVDFHKTLFQPVCSSAFLLRDQANFRYVSHYADYLNPLETENEEQPNLVEKSIQTTRRFDALKLWFTLKVVGEQELGAMLERVHQLAQAIYPYVVEDPCFETAHIPELSTLVFRYLAPGVTDEATHDAINLHIKTTLFNEGRASVAATRLHGRRYLKFTLLNPKLTVENLLEVLSLIKQEGAKYEDTRGQYAQEDHQKQPI